MTNRFWTLLYSILLVWMVAVFPGYLIGYLIGYRSGYAAGHASVEHVHGPLLVAHEQPRSGKWPVVRKRHLEKEPVCAVCGSTEDLQVHHIKQFSQHPELELDPENLITLCGPGGHNCHFIFGHLFRYKDRDNWHVREDAKTIRRRIAEAEGRQGK